MKLPWNIAFILTYSRFLTLASVLRLRRMVKQDKAGELSFNALSVFRLRSPYHRSLTFRPASNDMFTLQEIFVEQVYREIVATFPDARTVIDLGANIGFAAAYFVSHLPGVKIMCVEPDPQNVVLLSTNLSDLVEESRCRIVSGAVWRADEKLVLEPLVAGHVNSRSCTSIGPDAKSEPSEQVVQAYSIPTLIEMSGFSEVDLIKIDVEGAEAELFHGDCDWLDKVKAIAIEFHGNSRTESNFDDMMAEKGFKVLPGEGHTTTAIRIAEMGQPSNVC